MRASAGDVTPWSVTFFGDYVASLRGLALHAEAETFFDSLLVTNYGAGACARRGISASLGPLNAFLAQRVRDFLAPAGLDECAARVGAALAGVGVAAY